MKKQLMTLVMWALLVTAWTQADSVPMLINYQGKLQDNTGAAVKDGNYEVAFKIWSDGNAGTLIWGRSYPVHIVGGMFNVVLGDGGTSLSGAATTDLRVAFQQTTRYLGLMVIKDYNGSTINNPSEIVPRQQFLSAPYALNSALADNAIQLGGLGATNYLLKAGDAVNGNWVVNGTITVSGAASLAGSATIAGNLAVNGTLSAGNTVNGGFVPVGGIIMWSGSTSALPAGWALCDGGNGTPNLKDKFILGWGGRAVGISGGNENIYLSPTQLPAHSHSFSDYYFTEISGDWRGGGGWSDHNTTGRSDWARRSTDNTGSGAAVNIMPPFYVMAFIQRKI